MPPYPSSQHQHYANAALDIASDGHGGLGFSSMHYRRAENIIRYGSSLRNRYMRSTTTSNGRTHSKTVYRIDCRYCSAVICLRGMKAMLLADTTVELFSTDYPPGAVQLINQDYTTSNCRCKIRDVACRICGNVVGYHITKPCHDCLKAPNNGHFWMFHTDGVTGQERLSMDLVKLVQELVHIRHTQSSNPSGINITNDKCRPEVPAATNGVMKSARNSSTMAETSAHVPAVSTLLAKLSCSRFLQPLKWDQLPHPDLDIDLEPSSMGDEPLFADQWVDLITRAAETIAANMFLALDREDEMEWYIDQMIKEPCLGDMIRPSPQATELPESPDQGENIEQLIDLEDESRPSSPSFIAEDTKGEDCRDQEHRLEDVQPSSVPIPEQEEQMSLPGTAATMPALFRSDGRPRQYGSQDHSLLVSSVVCPASALNSAMIAKVAASAAEADATSTAHNLLYGRRGRRDYSTMCR